MSAPGNGNGFWKVFGAMLVPLALGLIGYGALKSDVRHVEQAVEAKASRETVNAQYEALLREIQSLRADIQRRR